MSNKDKAIQLIREQIDNLTSTLTSLQMTLDLLLIEEDPPMPEAVAAIVGERVLPTTMSTANRAFSLYPIALEPEVERTVPEAPKFADPSFAIPAVDSLETTGSNARQSQAKEEEQKASVMEWGLHESGDVTSVLIGSNTHIVAGTITPVGNGTAEVETLDGLVLLDIKGLKLLQLNSNETYLNLNDYAVGNSSVGKQLIWTLTSRLEKRPSGILTKWVSTDQMPTPFFNAFSF